MAFVLTLPEVRQRAELTRARRREAREGWRTVRRSKRAVQMMAESDDSKREQSQERLTLAKTNADVLKLSVVGIVVPLLFNEGLKKAGVDSNTSGLWTTALVMIGAVFTWTYTYFARVATKDMTYAKQLKDYEDEVLKQRYNELSDEELDALAEEIEDEQQKKK